MERLPDLKTLFHPRSVALIGASSDRIKTTPEVKALLDAERALMRPEPERPSAKLVSTTTTLPPPPHGDETRPMLLRELQTAETDRSDRSVA